MLKVLPTHSRHDIAESAANRVRTLYFCMGIHYHIPLYLYIGIHVMLTCAYNCSSRRINPRGVLLHALILSLNEQNLLSCLVQVLSVQASLALKLPVSAANSALRQKSKFLITNYSCRNNQLQLNKSYK